MCRDENCAGGRLQLTTEFETRTGVGVFGHLNVGRKSVFQTLDVSDDKDLFEVLADGLDRFDQVVQTLLVLRAEPLIDNERAETRARAVGRKFGQGDADGKIDPEGLSAGIELIA